MITHKFFYQLCKTLHSILSYALELTVLVKSPSNFFQTFVEVNDGEKSAFAHTEIVECIRVRKKQQTVHYENKPVQIY